MKNKKLEKLQKEVRELLEKYNPDATWALYFKDSETFSKDELEEELELDEDSTGYDNKIEDDPTGKAGYDKLMVVMSDNITEAVFVTALGLKGLIEATGNTSFQNSIIDLLESDKIKPRSSAGKKFNSFDDKFKNAGGFRGDGGRNKRSDEFSEEDYIRKVESLEFYKKYKVHNLQELISNGLPTPHKDEVYTRELNQVKDLFKAKKLLPYLKNKMRTIKEEQERDSS